MFKQKIKDILKKFNLKKIIGIFILLIILMIVYNYYITRIYAKEAQEAIRILWSEEQNYYRIHKNYITLKEFEHKINPKIRKRWRFQFFHYNNPRQIRAVSTIRMPGGFNHIVIYDVINDTWSGYGS